MKLPAFQLTSTKNLRHLRAMNVQPFFSKVAGTKNTFGTCVATLLFALIAMGRADAQTLYATTAAGAAGELYILNPDTGAVIQDVGPLNDASSVNYPVTGLAFNPISGVLYGSTGNNPAATAARLVTINPSNGLVTVIGSFDAGPVNSGGTPSTMGDLAFDSDGNLYGIGTIGGPQLYSISLTTGKATLIGSSGLSSTTGGGLAISSGGVFYGTPTSTRFGTYNSGTGAYSNIVAPALPAGGGYGALDYNLDGVLYGLNVGSGSPPPTHLVKIDPVTVTVTDLGASVDALDAIAFQPSAGISLSATLSGNTVTLRWPDSPGFQLEYKTNLSDATWLTNTTVPTVDGGTNSVSLTADGGAGFFRLRKP
jgi:hypothetical protein